jgi:hypothetical protein
MLEVLWAVVVGVSIGVLASVWRRVRDGSPRKRLVRYSDGRPVKVPLSIELTYDVERLPSVARQLNATAVAECDPRRGLLSVRGGAMVPGFEVDDFWASLRDAIGTESLRLGRGAGVVRLVVPLKDFPRMGIAAVSSEVDWDIITDALSKGALRT